MLYDRALNGYAVFEAVDVRKAELFEQGKRLGKAVCGFIGCVRVASERYKVSAHIAVELQKILVGQKRAVRATYARGVYLQRDSVADYKAQYVFYCGHVTFNLYALARFADYVSEGNREMRHNVATYS